MLFKPFTVFTLVAAVHVLAAPAAEEAVDDDLFVIYSRPVDDGMLVAYGSRSTHITVTPRSESAALCDAETVTCSGSHQANSNTCQVLITSIASSGGTVGSSPRSLCLNREGDQCCISWSRDIGSVAERDLFFAADRVFGECKGSKVSGLARNAQLKGQCLTQCLSNRPSGCR